MSITTYANLQTSIASWLFRAGDSTTTTVVPDFIALCEARLRRVIRTKETAISTLTTTASVGTLALPTGMTELRELVLAVTASYAGGPLEITSVGKVMAHRASRGNVTGTPQMAAIVNETLYLSPIPDAAYDIYATYEGPFLALSNSQTSNWILASYPDVYLYGSLVESAPFFKEDERMTMWENRFQQAMEELNIARERTQWPSSPTQRVPREVG